MPPKNGPGEPATASEQPDRNEQPSLSQGEEWQWQEFLLTDGPGKPRRTEEEYEALVKAMADGLFVARTFAAFLAIRKALPAVTDRLVTSTGTITPTDDPALRPLVDFGRTATSFIDSFKRAIDAVPSLRADADLLKSMLDDQNLKEDRESFRSPLQMACLFAIRKAAQKGWRKLQPREIEALWFATGAKDDFSAREQKPMDDRVQAWKAMIKKVRDLDAYLEELAKANSA